MTTLQKELAGSPLNGAGVLRLYKVLKALSGLSLFFMLQFLIEIGAIIFFLDSKLKRLTFWNSIFFLFRSKAA